MTPFSLEPFIAPSQDTLYDQLILGGGPAALTAAIYSARKMIRLALITSDFGGQVNDTSEIENYTGFQTISGQELTGKFTEHVKHFQIPVALGEKITEVDKKTNLFEIQVESGKVFHAKTVIVATGKRKKQLEVPGEKELSGRGVSYCSICDAPFFKGKNVIVAGGGNSAFTAVIDLMKVATEITLINYAKGFQADPVLVKAAKKENRVHLLDFHRIIKIEGDKKVTGVQIRDREKSIDTRIVTEGVFVEIGMLPNTGPLKRLAKLNDADELVVDGSCRTSVEGLFGAGDVTIVPYNQIVISAGEGAKAALTAYDYLIRNAD
jgi:NADH-dependent peroxiredoxin subunit F